MNAESLAGHKYVRKMRFEIDLSDCTLVQVLERYQAHVNNKNSNYSISAVIVKIKVFQTFYGDDLYPEDVTDLFWVDFINFLYLGCKLKYTSIKTYCGCIRSGLVFGRKHNAKLSTTFDEYKIPKNPPVKISLTTDEVSMIYHFDVYSLKFRKDKLQRFERIKDAFVLQCNLYQRYSDMRDIDANNFENGEFKKLSKKTNITAIVNLATECIAPAVVQEILHKYNYKFPYAYTLGKFNRGLHELLSFVGGSLRDKVVTEERSDNKVVKVERYKYQMITSHTARHTAATLAANRKMTDAQIRKCMGHAMGSYSLYAYYDFISIR